MENNMAGKKTNIKEKKKKGNKGLFPATVLALGIKEDIKDSNLSQNPAFPKPCAKSCRRQNHL